MMETRQSIIQKWTLVSSSEGGVDSSMSGNVKKGEVWLSRRRKERSGGRRWEERRSGKSLKQIKHSRMSEDSVLCACVCKCVAIQYVCLCGGDRGLDQLLVLPGNPL